jgi:hypothetical protein
MTGTAATNTRDQSSGGRICRNCWWRKATPGFALCTFCFHTPHKHRANAAWADLIAQVDAQHNHHERNAA